MRPPGQKGRYQKCMPVTSKNIGKDLLKAGTHAPPYKQGEREMARRRKQLARQQAKLNAN